VLSVGVVAVLVLGLTGCGGGASIHRDFVGSTVSPDTSPVAAAKAAVVLQELDAERLYVMAGDDMFKAGLGVVSATGLEPATTTPPVTSLSNVSGNGRTVVIGAAGAVDGFFLDGAYQLVGDQLRTLATPAERKYAPTVASDDTMAAVAPDGGFFIRKPGSTAWVRDRRLTHADLNSLSWGAHDSAFAVEDFGQRNARLVEIPREGRPRDVHALPCIHSVVPSPTRPWTATNLPLDRPAGCPKRRSHLIDLTGHHPDRLLPAGWDPLTWSRDSSAVLLARGHEIAVWQVASGELTDRVDLGVRIWMAAPLWSEG